MRLHNSGTWRHSAYVPYRKWRTRNHGSRAPRPTHIPMTVIWILRIQCIIPNHGYQSMIITLSRQSLQSLRLKLLFFFSFCLSLVFHGMGIPYLSPAVFGEHSTVQFPLIYLLHWRNVLMETLSVFITHCTKILQEKDKCEWRNCICSKMLQPNIWYSWRSLFRNSS